MTLRSRIIAAILGLLLVAPAGSVLAADSSIAPMSAGAKFQQFGTPYKQLGRSQYNALKAKIDARTITREEYARFRWNQRFQDRRSKGVAEFWDMEQARLQQGLPGTRNWTPGQVETILSGGRPAGFAGHHTYSATLYPQLANQGQYIYPVTFREHLYRWHGGNWRNQSQGVPLNSNILEDF